MQILFTEILTLKTTKKVYCKAYIYICAIPNNVYYWYHIFILHGLQTDTVKVYYLLNTKIQKYKGFKLFLKAK